MGRSPCCEKVGLKKGPWTPEEDQKLMAYIEEFGHGSWRALPAKAGLQRCGKSCRLRWTNYLRPDIKRGKFSLQEEQTIIQLHALLGNRWSAIAAQLPKRTDNEIKNYWNTHLKKRLTRMGIDPMTHKPKTDALSGSGSGESKMDSSNLSHMAQWESARLEAEARLVRESKLQLQQHVVHSNGNNNKLGSSSSSSSLTQPARLVLNKITALQPLLPPCLDILKAWQNSLSNQPTKDYINNNKVMHSMCAMMLSTDDTLESPTSTLSFPGTPLPRPLPLHLPTATTNVVGHLNENSLPLTTTTTNEPWGSSSLTNAEGEKREDNVNTVFNLQDDDIMAAVEAFRSAGYENISSVTPLSSNNNDITVLEALNNDEAMVYDSSHNLEEGDIANPGNSRSYWTSILGLVNDTLSGSSVF